MSSKTKREIIFPTRGINMTIIQNDEFICFTPKQPYFVSGKFEVREVVTNLLNHVSWVSPSHAKEYKEKIEKFLLESCIWGEIQDKLEQFFNVYNAGDDIKIAISVFKG